MSFTALADQSSSVVSKGSSEGSGCDLSVPGIDKEKFLSWFSKLKAAASTKDFKALNDFVLLPLQANTKPRKIIKNKADLEKVSASLFTPKVLSSISSQEIDKLFCRDQGVMTGSGEVWISQRGAQIGITSINPE